MKTNEKRKESLNFIELFAGVGGFRVGLNHVRELDSSGCAIENGDWNCVFMNQWEPSTRVQKAFDCYVKRFGNEFNECCNEDISKVDTVKMPSADLLVGGFPCLPAETLVLTNKGYIPIVDIKEGNQVIASDGQWHTVTKWMYQGMKETYTVKGFGLDGIQATGNHLFYIREKDRKSRTLLNPRWETVETIKDCLDTGYSTLYMGVPKIVSLEKYPDWQGVDVAVNQKKIKKVCHLDMTDSTLWYLVGRYLGDGWLRKQQKKGELRAPYSGVVICCGKHKKKKFDEKLSLNYPCTVIEEKTAYKYIFNSVEFAAFLRQFGNHAYKKKIPGFVYDLPFDCQKAILDGYMDSDGCIIENVYQISSINKNLMYSIAHIMETVLGSPSAIYCYVPEKTKRIEGRIVKQRSVYMVRNKINREIRTAFYDDGIFWYPIQSIEKDKGMQAVYDIAVADCHNFVANHCIVHNCQDYSVARSLNNELGIEGKKGVLFWEIARILQKKHVPFVLLENVDRLLLSPSKYRGRDFSIILKTLDTLGYNVEYRVINAGDYGMPQRRRRVFIFAYKKYLNYSKGHTGSLFDVFPYAILENLPDIDLNVYHDAVDISDGLLQTKNKEQKIKNSGRVTCNLRCDSAYRAICDSVSLSDGRSNATVALDERSDGAAPVEFKKLDACAMLSDSKIKEEKELLTNSEKKSKGKKNNAFQYGNFGRMENGIVKVYKVEAKEEKNIALKEILLDDEFVSASVYLDPEKENKLKYLKGSKKILRHHSDGTPWFYTEGSMAFPENLDLPGRTMLTSEGTVNRSSHVVADTKGCLRFLDPVEAERLQMFPDGWTDVSMTNRQRYFMMGNALVTGIIRRLEPRLREIVENEKETCELYNNASSRKSL